ncbi:MAG: amidohydrolase family protein [Ferruginibacter sp.]
MILSNVHIVGRGLQDIHINGSFIVDPLSIQDPGTEKNIQFSDAIVFPGLINSHDHLDFNLFPQTGNRIYKNYKEWADDIQMNNRSSLDTVLKIPKDLRIQYGLYKNLLNGFTTVVNHGKQLSVADDLITVLQDCHSLHSVLLEKNWKWKLNNPFAGKKPYVIHAGEGTDQQSKKEIDELIKWNIFKKELIAVHGVAMNKKQAEHFKALIWCPASNYFLLGATANIDQLKTFTNIVFGTDSTLSSPWNAWDHIRLARRTAMITDKELFNMLTENPAAVWGLNHAGKIAAGMNADVVVAKRKNIEDEFDAFFNINPEDILLIVRNGKILLFDEAVAGQLNDTGHFEKISISKNYKYVPKDIALTLKMISGYTSSVNILLL